MFTVRVFNRCEDPNKESLLFQYSTEIRPELTDILYNETDSYIVMEVTYALDPEKMIVDMIDIFVDEVG